MKDFFFSILMLFNFYELAAQELIFLTIKQISTCKSIPVNNNDSTDILMVEALLTDDSEDTQANRNELNLFLPLPMICVNSTFGLRYHPIKHERRMHKGVDLKAENDTVYSIMDGTVIRSSRCKSLGNFMEIDHGVYKSTYGHLSVVFRLSKERVLAGEPLGITGNTGLSSGKHLHFELKYKDTAVDPLPLLKFVIRQLNTKRL